MNFRHAAIPSLVLTSVAAFALARASDAPTTTVAPVTVVAGATARAGTTAAATTAPKPVSSAIAPTTGGVSTFAGSLALAATTTASPDSPCSGNYAQISTAALPGITVRSGGINGWDERYKGRPLSLLNASVDHCQTFAANVSLVGPMLYAKGRENFGLAPFDAAGGSAYKFYNGNLVLKAYRDAAGAHGGLIQSVSPGQAYNGVAVQPNQSGYTCAGCYWEARMKMPVASGTWAGFWLLSPDDPKNRGHLEVDGIEYYSLGNKRGHHHAIHRWSAGKSTGNNGYSLSDEIGDGQYHTYGIDLRGLEKIDGKPAIVIYMDGKEIDRLVASADYFTTPFYYLVNLTTSLPKSGVIDYPQALWIDHVTAWKPRA